MMNPRTGSGHVKAAVIMGGCTIAAALVPILPILSTAPTPAGPSHEAERLIRVLIDDHGTTAAVESTLVVLRSTLGLRPLMPLETGQGVLEAPYSTYFYACAGDAATAIMDEEGSVERGILAAKESGEEFEIHRLADGTADILTYVSQDAAASLTATGTGFRWVVAAPVVWGHMNQLVAIPVSRIQEARVRVIQTAKRRRLPVLDVLVRLGGASGSSM